MATIKIYGIKGMVERSLSIPCGGASLQVSFTGGSANPALSCSAKYKTDNAVYQAMIENSDYFRRGYIRLLGTITRNGGDGKASPKAVKTRVTPVSASRVAETAASAAPGASPKAARARVEVSDIEGEGKKYLVEKFGEKASDMRSLRQIVERAARHNVEFVLPGEKQE
ncbi:MAG: hypothetical protein LUC33_03125 [Prevotellaceae bacterium]|nr:hypothetical protein [Prevotellaceae bacterium]